MPGIALSPDISHIVLVAAHDEGLRGALEFMLRAEGYVVQTVEGGEALLKLQLPERGACIVLDQDVPRLFGLKTIEALRRRGVDLPVVLLVGQRADLAWWLALQSRVQLVEKPFRGEVVLRAVAATLGSRREPV